MRALLVACLLLSILLTGCCVPSAPVGPTFTPGQTVTLGSPGDSGLVPAADSRATMAEFIDAENANDTFKKQQLRHSRRVAPIQPGTTALYLRKDGVGIHVVRIQTGPYAGRESWVHEELIR